MKQFFVEKITLSNGSTRDMELFPDQNESFIMNGRRGEQRGAHPITLNAGSMAISLVPVSPTLAPAP